jgi:D-alanyl-D-alanine carboxypeptidase/D-alanyl-D-alanine-endopeptidase (penicillin-binding protein 4)
MANLPTPDSSTPIDQLRNRLATYQRLAATGKDQSFLRTAWRTERDPALRPVIAELLYRADPADSTNVAAFLDSFSADREIFGRLREAVGEGQLPVLPTLVDLAAGGNEQAISHLLALVASTGKNDPLEAELAFGMAEVGKNAPDELLAALEQQSDEAQLEAIRLLAKGVASTEDEERNLTEGTFANTLANEGADIRLTTFARTVETRLRAETPEATNP